MIGSLPEMSSICLRVVDEKWIADLRFEKVGLGWHLRTLNVKLGATEEMGRAKESGICVYLCLRYSCSLWLQKNFQ